MRSGFLLGLVLCFSIPSTAAVSPNVYPAAPPSCELHFWPASAVNTYPKPAQAKGGLVWALALGGQKRAEALQAVRSEIASNLDAEGSMVALGKADLAGRLGIQSATLIVHDVPLDPYGLNRIRHRRVSSSSPCYFELIVTGILYKNGSFGGHFLDSNFMLREFGAAAEPNRVTTGGGSIRLTTYPAKEGEHNEAANADLNSAFRQGFESFVAKVSKVRGF